MGVGFWLTGTIPSTASDEGEDSEWLQRAETWLRKHAGAPLEQLRRGVDHEGRAGVFAQLHPAAEELEILVPEKGRMIATNKTSTVGPGYHIWVCDLVRQLGVDLRVTWDPEGSVEDDGSLDETGYFYKRDPVAVEEEMLKWLRGMVRMILDREFEWLMVSMPLGHHYSSAGPMVTPLGPRGGEWLDAVSVDPRMGTDIFPWWSPGVGAEFYFGRALTRMWREIRWRPPLSDEEEELWIGCHLDLVEALKADPTLDFPWNEWRELLDHIETRLGEDTLEDREVVAEILRKAALTAEGPLIGYRREPVRAYLFGGWSIEIPGEMAESWDEEGTWSAWDGDRTLWFTAFTREHSDGRKIPAQEVLEEASDLPEEERLEFQNEEIRGQACFVPYQEEGEELWNLKAQVAADGAFAICNIYVHDPADRDWAVQVWQSLQHA
jgi:hypothetical protein